MLHKYGKEWFFENILKQRTHQTLEIRFSNTNGLIISYSYKTDVVEVRDDYIEGIKFVFDSLAEKNDTLFAEYIHTAGAPLQKGGFKPTIQKYMQDEFRRFFWTMRPWNYARIFVSLTETIPYNDSMELFCVQVLNMGAQMQQEFWRNYFKECENLNLRPVSISTIYNILHPEYTIEYTEEEKDLFIKYICMNDKDVLTKKVPSYYIVPFTYQPPTHYYDYEVENHEETVFEEDIIPHD